MVVAFVCFCDVAERVHTCDESIEPSQLGGGATYSSMTQWKPLNIDFVCVWGAILRHRFCGLPQRRLGVSGVGVLCPFPLHWSLGVQRGVLGCGLKPHGEDTCGAFLREADLLVTIRAGGVLQRVFICQMKCIEPPPARALIGKVLPDRERSRILTNMYW